MNNDPNTRKIMRSISLNEPLSVTLPAHVWLGFLAAYGESEWTSVYPNAILIELKTLLFDEQYLAEAEADDQAEAEQREQRHQQAHEFFSGIMPGRPGRSDQDNNSNPPDKSGAYL